MIKILKHFIRTKRAKKALKKLRRDRLQAQKLVNLIEQCKKEETKQEELKKALFALVEPQLKRYLR